MNIFQHIALTLRGMSQNSQRAYLGDIRDFCDFLHVAQGTQEAEEVFESLTTREVLLYQDHLRRRREAGEIKDTSIKRRIHALKAIFGRLHNEGLLKENPFRGCREKARGVATRKNLPFEKVRELLRNEWDDDESLQDQAILACLFGGALRRAEVANLRLDDFRLTNSNVPFLFLGRTKSQRTQEQGLPEWAAKKIARWIARRIERGAMPKDFIFARILSNGAHRSGMNESTVFRQFKKLIERVGLDPREYTLHEARHTAITKLVFDGVDIVRVQKFARHANINTTLDYNHARQGVEEGAGRELKY